MTGGTDDLTMISAHRCGNTRAALEAAAAGDVDLIELDVQRCRDTTLVVSHGHVVPIGGRDVRLETLTVDELEAAAGSVLRYDEVLAIIAGSGKRAHVDLKIHSPDGRAEVEAVALAVEILGDDRVVVTTEHDDSVAALTEWARDESVDLAVGLSLGKHGWETLLDLFPGRRFRRTQANVVAAHHLLARLRLARFARRRGLPLLVWTVDGAADLRYWLSGGRAWVVTTNHPAEALECRRSIAPCP